MCIFCCHLGTKNNESLQRCYSYDIKHSLNPFPLNCGLLPEMFISNTVCLVKTTAYNCLLSQVSSRKKSQESKIDDQICRTGLLCLFQTYRNKLLLTLHWGLIFLVLPLALLRSLYFLAYSMSICFPESLQIVKTGWKCPVSRPLFNSYN